MGEVKKVNTRWDPATVLAVLVSVLPGLDRWSASAMLAQMGLETGWGGPGCWNWNLGNISADPKRWTGDYWVPPWVRDERHLLHKLYLKHEAPGAFRAYPDLASGVRGYVTALQRYFPEILAAYRTQDPMTVWKAIRAHYMPDKLSTAKEYEAFANWRGLLEGKALQVATVAGLPEVPREVPKP